MVGEIDTDPEPATSSGEADTRMSARTPSTPDDHPPVVRLLAARYRLDRMLGQGGMGAVYLATDMTLSRLVAIKVVRPDRADERAKSRFFREAQALTQLSHPAIVPLLDFGIDGASGSPFTALRYIEGPSLAQHIRDHGPVDELTARRWLEALASALAHAHAHGVIHRDVKPENIMLEGAGTLEARLTDFGLVKLENAQPMTRTGVRLGTPLYMAPETAGGARGDARVDLYALGCLIDVMLVGRAPFTENDVWALFDAHQVRPPPPLPARLVDGNAPSEGLIALRLALLAKAPDDRPESARAVIDRLRMIGKEPRTVAMSALGAQKNTAPPRSMGLVLALGLAGGVGLTIAAQSLFLARPAPPIAPPPPPMRAMPVATASVVAAPTVAPTAAPTPAPIATPEPTAEPSPLARRRARPPAPSSAPPAPASIAPSPPPPPPSPPPSPSNTPSPSPVMPLW